LVNQLLKAAAGIDFNTFIDRLVVNSSAFFLPSPFSLQPPIPFELCLPRLPREIKSIFHWGGIPPFGRDSAPLVGGNDELLITHLFKYCKASNIAMLTVQLANVHHFHQVGGSAQLRIGRQKLENKHIKSLTFHTDVITM